MMKQNSTHNETVFNPKLTVDRMHAQCDEWMTDLHSCEEEMRFLKDLAMDHAANLVDRNKLLRFRYNAALLNGELRYEARELKEKVRQIENMIQFKIDENMTVSVEDVYNDHLNVQRRLHDFYTSYVDVREELLDILGSGDPTIPLAPFHSGPTSSYRQQDIPA